MRSSSPPLPIQSRRHFLKRSALAIAAPTAINLLTGCSGSPVRREQHAIEADTSDSTAPFKQGAYLDEQDIQFFRAASVSVLPELGQSDPAEIDQLIRQIDAGFVAFGPVTQNEFSTLLSLLTWAPTRVSVAGVWSDWASASEEAVDNFLADWHDSGSTLLNTGFNGIVKIISTGYYGRPANYAKAGYPGPPDIAISNLPQFQQAQSS